MRSILWLNVILLAAIAASLVAAAPENPRLESGAQKGEFSDDLFFYGEKRPQRLRALEGKAAPALQVNGWIGKEQTLAKLNGKVVIVDFWATWCRPCMQSLPHNVELVKSHGERGLMFIGVHDAARGSEKMPAVAKDMKINYPLSVDDGGKSAAAYKVSFWPTYVAIDRKGVIRAAGLRPESVEQIILKLLDEPAPESTEQPSQDKPAAPG